MNRKLGASAAILLASACAIGISLPASADEPSVISDHVTDLSTEQVASGQSAQIEAQIQIIQDESKYDLFVVFVDDFNDWDPIDWADESAIISGLDTNDVLFALAVGDQNPDWAVSIADSIGLTDAQLRTAFKDVYDPFDAGNYGEAALAGATGLAEVVVADASGGVSVGAVLGGGLGIIAAIAGFRAFSSSRKRKARTASQAASVADLNRQVSVGLVEIDDSLRSSANELEFATLDFGTEATKPFNDALTEARGYVDRAFAVYSTVNQNELGSHEPQLRQALELLTQAQTTLNAQKEQFEKLRDLQRNAPQALTALEGRIAEARNRVGTTQTILQSLAAAYSASALATVNAAPERASALLDAANQAVVEGKAKLEAMDNPGAVTLIRTAEESLTQANKLLTGVESAQQTLSQAPQKLQAAIGSIRSDIADADRLASGNDTVANLVAQAQKAIEIGTQASGGGGDPIAALNQLTQAEAALDNALDPLRAAASQHRDLSERAQSSITHAEMLITQTNSFIDTSRGAVGPLPRQWLAQAIAQVRKARTTLVLDPTQALELASQATSSANSALNQARQEVQAWSTNNRHTANQGGIDLGSLILGGVLGRQSNSTRNPWGSSSSGWGGGGISGGTSWGGGTSSGWGSSSRTSSSRSSSRSRSRSSGFSSSRSSSRSSSSSRGGRSFSSGRSGGGGRRR